MDDCIFCLIAQGKLPSSKIFETENLYAFLDLNPCHEGHTLIIPKKHSKDVFGVDSAFGKDLLEAIQRIGKAIIETTGATGMNVLQNNGRDAGQMVDHVHWHLIPRFANDGFKLWPQGKYDSPEAMNDFAAKIREKIK